MHPTDVQISHAIGGAHLIGSREARHGNFDLMTAEMKPGQVREHTGTDQSARLAPGTREESWSCLGKRAVCKGV